MEVLIANHWKDYELIDSGDGKRLERFGKYTLLRPDPQTIWPRNKSDDVWQRVDAVFQEDTKHKGRWTRTDTTPYRWLMQYNDVSFYAELTPFKHTGIFPEQTRNWDWITEQVTSAKQPNVLNLFAYTGVASLVATQAGARVTHVDASKSTIAWARENQTVSNLQDKPIRWIYDDVLAFCQREVRRGVRYDGIIMDPPVYGHGPEGQVWDFTKSFPQLMQLVPQLLTPTPLFLLINAYAISASAIMLENVLKSTMAPLNGKITVGELALEEKGTQRLLSTGIFARWKKAYS